MLSTTKKELLMTLRELKSVRGRKVSLIVNGGQKYISKNIKSNYMKKQCLLNLLEILELNGIEKIYANRFGEVIQKENITKSRHVYGYDESSIQFVTYLLIFVTVLGSCSANLKSLQNKIKESSKYIQEEQVTYEIAPELTSLIEEYQNMVIDEVINVDYANNTRPSYTKNFACPKEWEDYIFEYGEKYDIPVESAFIILDQESDGNWNLNGVISSTQDYGVPQINIRNHESIKQALGYTSDDILYDPCKSLDAMFYILRNIFDKYGYTKEDYDLATVAGTYNGWVDWQTSEWSTSYANECIDRYNDKIINQNEAKKLSYVSVKK